MGLPRSRSHAARHVVCLVFITQSCWGFKDSHVRTPKSSTRESSSLPPDAPSPINGWVRAALANSTLDVGNQSVPAVKLNFTNIVCGHLRLGHISAVPDLPSLAVNLSVHNTTAQCTGGWFRESRTQSGPFDLNATVALVSAEVALERNTSGLIDGARLHKCKIHVRVNMSFGPNENAFEQKVIEVVETHITKGIGDALCVVLDVAVAIDLGGGLENLTKLLEPFVAPIVPGPPIPVRDPTDVLDLQRTPLLELLGFVTTEKLGFRGIESIVDFLLPNGSLSGAGLPDTNVTVILGNATVVLGLVDFNVSGLNTFHQFAPFQAVGAQTLQTDVSLGRVGLHITAFAEVQPRRGGPSALQWFEVTVQMDNVTLATTTELVVQRSKMDALQHRFPNLDCVKSTFAVWNTTFMNFSADVSQTSKVLLAGGNIDRDVDLLVNAVLDLALASFEPVLPHVIRGVLNGPGRAALNEARANAIGSVQCDPNHLPPDLRPEEVLGTTVGFATLLVVAVIVVFFATLSRRRRAVQAAHLRLYSLPNDTTLGFTETTDAVLTSTRISFIFRLSIVMLLLGTLGLYVLGTASRGSAVNLEVEVGGSPVIHPPPLYYMSLLGSVRDAYRAHVYPLSIFIGVSNIFGPAARVAVLLHVSSSMTLVHSRRVFVASVANFMGRFVFAQAFLISLMMLAFRYDLELRGEGAPTDASAHVFIVPDWWAWWGIALCTATGILASNFILIVLANLDPVWGQKSRKDDPNLDQDRNNTWQSYKRRELCRSLSTVWGNQTEESSRRSTRATFERFAVPVALSAAIVAIVYGSTVPAFEFHFKGVVEFLAETTHSKSSSEYTFWTSLWDLPSPRIGHPSGIAFIQGLKLLTAFVFPLIQAVAIGVIWEIPMSPKMRRWAGIGLQLVTSWAALDVLCIATTVAFTQIHLFAMFITGDKCNALIPLLNEPNVTRLLHGDPKCLDIGVTLRSGLPLMGFAALTLHVLAAWVGVKARSAALNDNLAGVTSHSLLHTHRLAIQTRDIDSVLLGSEDTVN
eukprot:m.207295 g.207295  ORF g.207295 m.207295 type:complete len:1032 (-) comp15444_c0_seq5:66-3161(-)